MACWQSPFYSICNLLCSRPGYSLGWVFADFLLTLGLSIGSNWGGAAGVGILMGLVGAGGRGGSCWLGALMTSVMAAGGAAGWLPRRSSR